MAPSFLSLKELRRRSRASFRTDRSADSSADSSASSSSSSSSSSNATPTSGSLTPPSIAQRSDTALDLQVKDQARSAPAAALPRPHSHSCLNGSSNRHSVSGMTGLGSPLPGGKGLSLPASQYSPRVTNVPDGSWVSDAHQAFPFSLSLSLFLPLSLSCESVTMLNRGGRSTKKSSSFPAPSGTRLSSLSTGR